MSNLESRKIAFQEFNANVQNLIVAVSEENYDLQIAEMIKAMEALERAKLATLKIYGGISN